MTMTLDVNLVEAIWLIVNSATLALTIIALVDAMRDAQAVKALNGHAVGIAARSNVRREFLRAVVQVLLLGVAIPLAFSDNVIRLSFPVVCLIAVPIVLLIQTILDTRERWRLTAILADHLVAERVIIDEKVQSALDRLGQRLDAEVARNDAVEERADVAEQVQEAHQAADPGHPS